MYLDTSILIKLFVPEPDSIECLSKVEWDRVVTSELTYAELLSGLLRKERTGEIDQAVRDRAWEAFSRRISDESISLEPLDSKVITRAQIALRTVHPQVPLKALDALHLATAASVEEQALFTADRRMQAAAKLLGLAVVE